MRYGIVPIKLPHLRKRLVGDELLRKFNLFL